MAKHQFQTEVGQLLHLMTHSLYSNKEIFIRELVSNASDAIDKLNYLRLTDENLKDKYAQWKGEINISFDEKDKSLSIIDNGIGMNEADLIASIGTIAKSGTKSFVEALTGDAKKDSNLIGQFGVGFYSVFMVADKVDVISKKAGEEQAYKWSSTGTGEFDLTPCTKESNGTVIYIKLKDEEAGEFASKYRIKNIVEKYSNHIAYPIFLNYDEEVSEALSEEDEKAGKKPEKKIERKHEQINAATALWMQPKAKLKEQDYNDFYKSISHDSSDPMLTIHTKTEGVNEYTTLFYIPKIAPMDMYRADFQSGVKLYVKRVFITDDEKELLPTYLRFVRGIIDSEDLPLNVSREILQENRILANIKQGSVKKILAEIKKLSKDEEKYAEFVAQYIRPLKEGVYQDYTNKEAILELLRYKSSKTEAGKMTSLEAYKERANSEQKAIYYIVGENEKVLRNSPLLESYKKNDIEVLILDDKEIDEIITPAIGAFKEWEFKDITAIEPPKVEQSEEEKKEVEEKFQDILSKIKDKLGDAVKDVKVTSRLSESPSCVVKDAADAQMAAMAHMFRAMGQAMPESAPILEINPEHEIVKKLNGCADEATIEDVSWILLDQAKLSEGMEITDTVAFAQRLSRITAKAL
ncbi:heat shock protein 90 HtpG [Aliarcobacter butzleri RM4018]|uniref:Chaperone protein HtpG n=1 Tax=Aliarcobacter butzleri (strain RM4018) TaxID=367737 RepID=HTPG_ALIB4|nr:molecular chaperone HtpG [Aliarcobacter butzleri]A8EV23.1 RecName: Full=Chaperone protein HtpG; AltName: Full=Heat shock protein HtpG; AltName: Full=High temperature protein G [Aliarcobacter butzleri RM4018]ABV67796.1 heat shock protein 90 HtpG [Aliarcobacter butzleri RM4018]GGT77723.1 chaperone protein HtpG [Aliarcobacter butzleri]SNV30525.1 High temperature protein G [Aliarcobacter butzleri]